MRPVHSFVVSFLSFLFFKTYHVLDPNNTVCPATILVVNENFEGQKIKITPYI